MRKEKAYVDVKWNGTKIVTLHRPNWETFAKETGKVIDAKIQRIDRSDEIISQMGSFESYFSIILGLNESSHPYTHELMRTILNLAGDACMPAKHYLACPRPERYDVLTAPFIDYPGHGSFPSGHATQAFALATVLKHLTDKTHLGAKKNGRKKLLDKQADRIAFNRIVAGVHFPVDNSAGKALGEGIGSAIVSKLTDDLLDPKSKTPMINWLWNKARSEFATHGGT